MDSSEQSATTAKINGGGGNNSSTGIMTNGSSSKSAVAAAEHNGTGTSSSTSALAAPAKDDEPNFDDFSDLKKKKKPKKAVNFDANPIASEHPSATPMFGQEAASMMAASAKQNPHSAATADDGNEEEGIDGAATKTSATAAAGDMDLENFDMLKKKKKTKKILPEDFDALSIAEAAGETEENAAVGGGPTAAETDEFEGIKKKKSKKKKADADAFEAALEASGGGSAATHDYDISSTAAVTNSIAEGVLPWAGSERDYTYPELLSRLFALLPESGGRNKHSIIPPQVSREGAKKTALANLTDIARRMRRDPDHITQFLYSELATEGSKDGSGRLIIKGRFVQSQLEQVLKDYYRTYVICKTCKSTDTRLEKENRLLYVSCAKCGSKRSVVAVKEGFRAQVGKRKKAVT